MAIKIKNIPVIDDNRNIINIEKIGIGTTQPISNLDVVGDINVSGVITAANFVGLFSGTATNADTATYSDYSGIATSLQVSRSFQITGDIIASPVLFDGSSNVSLAATIQPNSVTLGSDTTGDYVQSISGTANQISVSITSGESAQPVISILSNPLLPGNVTTQNDLQVNGDLNVSGNITIGGTAAYIISNDFRVKDGDIVTGFTTDSYGNDVSNDTTANHGGIAVASTEGTPLVQLYNVSIGETNPATYKKIMWFKSGSFAGLNTDAWLFNYGVGIGSTQIPNGVRLSVGEVHVGEYDIIKVRNINSSGIITASSFVGNLSGNATTAGYATTAGISTAAQGLTGSPNINVGIVTAGTVRISSGIITATSGIVTYYGDGSKLTGISTATGIVIQNAGSTLGTATTINFSTNLTASFLNGTATITASGGGGGSSLSINSVTTSSTNYVTFVSSASTTSIGITESNLTFVPSTGNLSAVQFTSLSDRSQKKNIVKINNALEIVNQLEGVRFDWVDNNKPSIGVIAQDVEKILPETVETNDNGLKSVSYGNIIGVLIEAIKEQQIRIEELERKLNA